MDNLISRQSAIDAIKGLPTWWADEGGYYGGAQPPMKALLDPTDAVSAIEKLPSAQPWQIGDSDRVYDELSKVYNMKGLPDEAYSIIGDLMLSLPECGYKEYGNDKRRSDKESKKCKKWIS